jgi:hypothetical protein
MIHLHARISLYGRGIGEGKARWLRTDEQNARGFCPQVCRYVGADHGDLWLDRIGCQLCKDREATIQQTEGKYCWALSSPRKAICL